MSVTAALISQPLRAHHCVAFLLSESDSSFVLTSDPSAFDESSVPCEIRILGVSPPRELLPSQRLTRGRIYRSLLARARAGSRFGRWLERTIKRLAWRLRYLDRATMLLRRSQSAPVDPATLRNSVVYKRLAELHEESQIGSIAVFDVFDLPVALAFAKDHGQTVVVR